MVLAFIDFVAAYDTESHAFLDKALAEISTRTRGQKARITKCRAMIRAIYEKATASVRVGKADGTNIFSEPFSVGQRSNPRGQGVADVLHPSAATAPEVIRSCMMLEE